MNFLYATYLFWMMLLGCIAFAHPAFAQTRLGLHVTQEELNIWRTRMTDNVNTINGVTFQTIYNTRIKADADRFVAQSHPGGDGFWIGYTGAGCQPIGLAAPDPGAGGTPFGRGNGAYMMRSAFNFLLTGNTAYANPVRTELLAQIAAAGTDWNNTAKWCNSSLDNVSNVLEIGPWIHRLVISYDYLIAGGYTGFSESEKTNIKNWFLAIANRWSARQIAGGAGQAGAHPGVYDTPQTFECVGSPCTTNTVQLYVGGPTAKQATQLYFSDVAAVLPGIAMAVGLVTNTPSLIDFAVKWVTGLVTAGIFDEGAVEGYAGYNQCSPPCVGSSWVHAAAMLNPAIAIADMYARNGNTSLYDRSVATQIPGGGGGTVSLQLALEFFAKLANHTITVYQGSIAPTNVLSWDTLDGFGNQGDFYHDFGSAVANLYYRNSHIKTAMERNYRVGSGAHSGDCFDPQYAGCFSGIWASWADLPFMYGKMEGKVNPYGGRSAASVSLTESPTSITSGQSSTLSWLSSNVTSCTASDGWSGSKATSGTQTVSPTQTTTYTLTCTGSGGSASASAEVTVLSPLTHVRINSGGPAYTGTDATYEADRYASGGNTYSTTASIANTPDPTLYQTVRWGNFTHEIPMANGTYNVTLKFAEVSRPGVGQRVFNVDINGTRVLSNFDIVAQAGSGYRAIDRTFPATVSNGMLSIAFSSVVDYALVSAIEVNPYGTEPVSPTNLHVSFSQ